MPTHERAASALTPETVGRVFFLNFPNPILVVDADGGLVSLNRAAEDQWAANPSELLGVPWMEAFPVQWAERADPFDWPSTWKRFTHPEPGSSRLEFPLILTDRNGHLHPIRMAGVPGDLQGAPYCMLVFSERAESLDNVPAWAMRDPLTGLANRAYWEAQRRGWDKKSGIIGIADLDQLKSINDGGGHRDGDQALRKIGQTLLRMLPANAEGIRYGGDEFVLVWPGGDLDAARQWGNDVNTALQPLHREELNGPRIHLTWGWAAWNSNALDAALAEADAVLYAQKGLWLTSASGGRLLLRTREGVLSGSTSDSALPGYLAKSFGPEFDRAFRIQQRLSNDLAQQFIDWTAPEVGTAVVEIGAGTGRLAFDGGLATRIGETGQLLLTDPARPQLEQAYRRVRTEGTFWVQCLLAPAETLPLAAEGADLVLGAVFLHLCDRHRAIREMARVVRPGGRVALEVILEFKWPPAWETILEPVSSRLAIDGLHMTHFSNFQPGDVPALLAHAGLQVERTHIVDAGQMEFPDAALARHFFEQGGFVELMTRDLPRVDRIRLKDLVLDRIAPVFDVTPVSERSVPYQLEWVAAKKPRA